MPVDIFLLLHIVGNFGIYPESIQCYFMDLWFWFKSQVKLLLLFGFIYLFVLADTLPSCVQATSFKESSAECVFCFNSVSKHFALIFTFVLSGSYTEMFTGHIWDVSESHFLGSVPMSFHPRIRHCTIAAHRWSKNSNNWHCCFPKLLHIHCFSHLSISNSLDLPFHLLDGNLGFSSSPLLCTSPESADVWDKSHKDREDCLLGKILKWEK